MPDNLDPMRQAVAQSCMQVRDLMSPILESAEGVKADMMARGWTAGNVETVAAYVQSMLKAAIGGGT